MARSLRRDAEYYSEVLGRSPAPLPEAEEEHGGGKQRTLVSHTSYYSAIQVVHAA